MRKESELTRESSSCPGLGQRLVGTGNPPVLIPPRQELPQDHVFQQGVASGDHAPQAKTTPFCFSGRPLTAEVFWPAREAVATVSSGVRGLETSYSRSRADVHNVGEGRESERGLPGGQWRNCQRRSGTDTAQGGDRGPDQSQL